MEHNLPTRSVSLFNKVKAVPVARGSSFTAYCASKPFERQNATKALCGDWRSPRATAIVQEILDDLDVWDGFMIDIFSEVP